MVLPTSSPNLKFVLLFVVLGVVLALWLFLIHGVAMKIGGLALYALMIGTMLRIESRSKK